MAEAFDAIGMVYQNLEDAGCDKQTIERCMALIQSENPKGMLPMLASYRKKLLDTVRSGQKKVDCLDYLIYQIQKNNLGGSL